MPKTIILLDENHIGNDYIIGDVHGSGPCMREVVKLLQSGDRLFIVGDLVDRGGDGIAVIKLICENRHRIFVVRGNHEQLCLFSINDWEKIGYLFADFDDIHAFRTKLDSLSSLTDEELECRRAITHHIDNNKGLWISKLFVREILEKKILLNVTNKTITYRPESQVLQIKKYLKSLPYIIHVQGRRSFNVVHADMPFPDQELRYKHENGIPLSVEEQRYVLWARADDSGVPIRACGRTSESTITFCGHSPIKASKTVPTVRAATNTVNLDIEMHRCGVALVVNHTHCSTSLVGPKRMTAMHTPHIVAAQRAITRHLQIQNQPLCSLPNDSTVAVLKGLGGPVPSPTAEALEESKLEALPAEAARPTGTTTPASEESLDLDEKKPSPS